MIFVTLRSQRHALATAALVFLGAASALAQGTNQGGRGGTTGPTGGGGFTGGGGGSTGSRSYQSTTMIGDSPAASAI